MKFGKTITSNQVPEWSHNYMNYKDLKKQIKQVQEIQNALNVESLGGSGSGSVNGEDSAAVDVSSSHKDLYHLNHIEVRKALASFFFSIDRNIELVDDFYNKQYSEYDKRLKKLRGIVMNLNSNSNGNNNNNPNNHNNNHNNNNHANNTHGGHHGYPGIANHSNNTGSSQAQNDSYYYANFDNDEIEELIGILVEIRSVFRNLKWYAELNKRGFIKILKKLDKRCGTSQRESFLISRVYPLSFANEGDILANLTDVNNYLNDLSPLVKLGLPRNATPSSNDSSSVSSSYGIGKDGGSSSSSLEIFLKFIEKDDAESLMNQLIEQYRSIVLTPTKLLISLLNKSALYKAKGCIARILEFIPSLSDPSDISGRNFFHHHVITLGKKVKTGTINPTITSKSTSSSTINKEKNKANIFQLNSHLNLTAAKSPSPNSRLIGSYGSDGINSNDSPDSLLYILQNLPPHLRPSLLQKDHYKRTPLHYSSQYGLKGITEIILKHLKEWTVWDDTVSIDDLAVWGDAESLSPLHLAVLGSHPKTIEVLVSNSNYKLNSSRIFLLAVRLNSPKILEILLNCHGIDINYVDGSASNNETALYIASKLNYVETVEFLLQKNANMEVAESSFGWTPIFIAAVEGLLGVVNLLKYYGANYTKVDESGWTPMEHACLRGHLQIADILKPEGEDYEKLIKNVLNDFSNNSSNLSINETGGSNNSSLSNALRPTLSRGNSNTSIEQTPKTNIKEDLYKVLKQHKSTDSSLAHGGTNSNGFNSIRPQSPPPAQHHTKLVKQFGHRYLEDDESLIVITLGSNDIRKETPVVQLDRVPISKVHSTELDTALSLVISKKCKPSNDYDDNSEDSEENQPIVVDLPLDDIEPITFRSKHTSSSYDHKNEIIYFDIIPTYGGQQKHSKILGRAVAIMDKIYTKVGEHRSSLNKLITLPIIETETLDLLGTINFEVLIVTPFVHPNLNINITETYWKSLIQSRVIGHRGLGKNNNDKNSLQLGENTLESFIAASSLGASYVEFDVQLTKDHVPVVYHDFLVAESGVDIPMHNLTLEQFLHMNRLPDNEEEVKHTKDDDYVVLRSRPKSSSYLNKFDRNSLISSKMKLTRTFKEKGFKGNSRGDSIASSFVTLKELFKKVPKNVGFNIECKYPLLFEAQSEDIGEVNVDLNHWIDTVLKIVFDNMDGRDVIFSSFHPEACLLLSLKQPNIPILFLTESGTSEMPDVRTGSLQSAIRFCKRWNLLGIVSACEPIVKCPRLAGVVKSSGLVCFTYGVENNDPKNSNLQMEAGVDAVIVDNVLAVRKGLTKFKNDEENSTVTKNEVNEIEKIVTNTGRIVSDDVIVE